MLYPVGVDFVARLLALLDQHPRQSWEKVLRTELRGRHYIACATGRQDVKALIQAGVASRTARQKIYGR